jgi:hypothetical protein
MTTWTAHAKVLIEITHDCPYCAHDILALAQGSAIELPPGIESNLAEITIIEHEASKYPGNEVIDWLLAGDDKYIVCDEHKPEYEEATGDISMEDYVRSGKVVANEAFEIPWPDRPEGIRLYYARCGNPGCATYSAKFIDVPSPVIQSPDAIRCASCDANREVYPHA